MTPEFVLRLGQAAGAVLLRAGKSGRRPIALIGKDTRVSGYMLEAALEAGLSSMGVDVRLTGPLPTPGVAYLTRALRLDAGIVISASHNPFEDNGIKFFTGEGNKLPDEVENRIEAMLHIGDFQHPDLRCVESSCMGRARRIDDAAGRYIEFCKSAFPQRLDLKGLKLVVDTANGAAYHVAAPVFHELGASIVELGREPDGMNINRGCGATHPEAMRAKVLETGADLGIALDGDADRVVMCDGSGRLYHGDELLWIVATNRLRRSAVPGVVGTLMSNYALERALAAHGIAFERARVGDRYVHERLLARGWQLGGEGSGHLLALDLHTTGDGIISALQILAAVVDQSRTMAELCAELQLLPQVLLNVPANPGYNFDQDPDFRNELEQVDRELAGSGRTLIRASGTEAVIRVMVECPNEQRAQTHARRLAASLAHRG
jgi:phosphoglucosamine mutase